MRSTPGQSGGVGLSVPGLKGATGLALRRFVEGESTDIEYSETTDVVGDVGDAPERARKTLQHIENDALYKALDVLPETEGRPLEHRIDTLVAEFTGAIPNASPPQAARLKATLTALERVRRVLTQPMARLEYDFRAGHVRAAQRIKDAADGRGPDISTLRKVWSAVHSRHIQDAAKLTRLAFQARQQQDLVAAVQYGRKALEKNPFFEELEKTVSVWSRSVQSGSGQVTVPPPRPDSET